MVKKMNTDEYIAWQNLYTIRLDRLRAVVIQAIFDAKRGLLTEKEASDTIALVNEEVRDIIECGRLIKQLKEAG
ncbi:hypothetical protein LCGC14_1157900 [marine sediment metagenome]|uniref:Uncharacterized protein n=1 Tax=marine sediment metagenome TaxID=412755 RepID=A0A0F9LTL1_9ZZZZ